MQVITIRVLITPLLLLLLAQSAKGQFHAVHIPESRLAKMKMDGDSTDWDWIPQAKYTSRAAMSQAIMPYTLLGVPVSEDSLNFKFVVGWNEVTNRIYVLAIVHDRKRASAFIPPGNYFFFSDCVEIMSNPMSDVLYGHDLKYHFIFPMANKQDEVNVDMGPNWIKESKNDIEFSGKLWKEKNGSYAAVYEISLTLWDKWDNRGPMFSRRHRLAVNEQFPLGFWFDNDTYQDAERLMQWTTVKSTNAIWDPFDLSSFVMDAPAEKDAIWAGVNRVLKP